MVFAPETLRVNFIHVFRARGSRGEPAVGGDHLHAADRRVIARRLGKHGGTPLILPRWLYARALGISGDGGLKELVGHLPPETLALLTLPTAASDVDTPRDLAHARRCRRTAPDD